MGEKIEIRPGRTVNILIHQNPHAEATVFLLHGLGARGEHWYNLLEALKHRYSVIIPDMLGHGNSDKPPPGKNNAYRFTELDQDVKAIFNRFASERNIIAGHSYGGALATSLTLANQVRVGKLILVSPTPLAPSLKIPFLFTLPATVMEWIRPILEKVMLKMIFNPHTDPAIVKHELEENRKNPMDIIKATTNGLLGMPTADISPLTTPTLLVLGKLDKLIPPDVSTQFYEVLPNLQIVTFDDVSHVALLEQPRKLNELVLEFIR